MEHLVFTTGASPADAAFLLQRCMLGGFFVISGAHKLWHPARRKSLADTFKADGVYHPAMMLLVPGGELLGGLGIVSGTLTALAAVGLAVICVGACIVDGWKRIKAWAPLDAADVWADVLYLPETLYVLMLISLILTGPGVYSIDNLLSRLI